MFSPDVCPNTVKNPETDLSPLIIPTILQNVHSTVQIERSYVVTSKAVDVGWRTTESDDELSLSQLFPLDYGF